MKYAKLLITYFFIFLASIITSINAMEAPVTITEHGIKPIRVRFYNDTPNVIYLELRQLKHFVFNLPPITNVIHPGSDVLVDLLINPRAFTHEQIIRPENLKIKLRNGEIEGDAIGDVSGMMVKKGSEGKVQFSINIWQLLKKHQECGSKDVRVNIMPPTEPFIGMSWLSTTSGKPNIMFLCN